MYWVWAQIMGPGPTGTSLAFPSLLLVQLPLGSHHQRVKLYSGMGGQEKKQNYNIKRPLGAIPFQIITTTTTVVTSGVDYYLLLYNFVRKMLKIQTIL